MKRKSAAYHKMEASRRKRRQAAPFLQIDPSSYVQGAVLTGPGSEEEDIGDLLRGGADEELGEEEIDDLLLGGSESGQPPSGRGVVSGEWKAKEPTDWKKVALIGAGATAVFGGIIFAIRKFS